ncbi:hypothetical protein ACFYKX_02875 [Cytobacillus sp. FJAT-54145]|uniref:Uncharacterized protein n=1 Tax=Cytobacillus spartinae TaxID=3299023 RepID=A0ABW6K7K1_9BACI
MKFNFYALLIILLLNIVITQHIVHQYYFQNYMNSIILTVVNLLLFPLAIYIYKKDRKRDA